MNQIKILVITPVQQIVGVPEKLKEIGSVTYIDDPVIEDILPIIDQYNAIFTNPNKSRVFIGKDLIDAAKKLSVICTASTGTNHIDIEYTKMNNITVISLTNEMEIIRQISSTAELAFGLMLSALRHIPQAFDSVKNGNWDYTKYIGRQMNFLTIGVVGYGRLGSIFVDFCTAFTNNILVYDPYKVVAKEGIRQVDEETLIRESDIISIHVHITPETFGMVNKRWFSKMKSDVILVNTSRGDIINEDDAIDFLRNNKDACFAVDVITNEISSKSDNKFIDYAREHNNLIITPHIGGMTQEGQQIAYHHSVNNLKQFFAEKKEMQMR